MGIFGKKIRRSLRPGGALVPSRSGVSLAGGLRLDINHRSGGGAAVYTPPSIPGLLALYRFNEGSGSSLVDWSGNARHGTLVGSPAWGTPGGLTCTGSQRVTLPNAVMATSKTHIFVSGQMGGSYHTFAGSNDGGELLLFQATGAPTIFKAGVGATTDTTAPVKGIQMVTLITSATAASDRLYQHTQEMTYSNRGSSYAHTRTTPTIGNGLTSLFPAAVALYYAAFFSIELDTTQLATLQASIQSDLSSFWGMGRQVIVDGNSLLEGSANPSTPDKLITKLTALLPVNVTVTLVAASGQQTSSMVTTGPRNEYDIRRPKNVYICWEGTNDLALGSVSTATAHNNIAAVCAAQRNRGCKVVVGTILPRTDAGTFTEANRQTVNTLIRNNWTTYADAIADFDLAPTIGAAGANLTGTYINDNVHLGATGNDAAAPILGTAV